MDLESWLQNRQLVIKLTRYVKLLPSEFPLYKGEQLYRTLTLVDDLFFSRCGTPR